jgi:hypothetical protein
MRATGVTDLARHELMAAARRLVVEQDARAGKEAITLAIVDGDVMAVHLGHVIGAPRGKRRDLALRRLAHLAKHFTAAGMVRAGFGANLAYRFKQAGHADRGKLCSQHRLEPARRHE